MTEEYIRTLIELSKAIDEGIETSRLWLDSLILNREAVSIRIQESRAELHGVVLKQEYAIPYEIALYISENYHTLMDRSAVPMRLLGISETHFTLELFGFQFEIPVGMIKLLG